MVAILSTDVLPDIRMTVDEYLAADLPEGHSYELVDGVVEVTPTPSLRHDMQLNRLVDALHHYRQTPESIITYVSQRASVAIPGADTVREPDLAVYAGPMPEGDPSAWKRVIPIWVAEIVSPLQSDRDYDEKRRDYLTAGVREYWIVDGRHRTVTVLSRTDDDWEERVIADTDEARSFVLPEFSVAVASLFASSPA